MLCFELSNSISFSFKELSNFLTVCSNSNFSASKFAVTAASGNTDIQGTLTVATTISVGANIVVRGQQAAIGDVADTNLPTDGAIGGNTISATVGQAEVQALQDEVEKLRDLVAELRTTTNSALAMLRTHGLIAT